jgi:glyoxylate reductase
MKTKSFVTNAMAGLAARIGRDPLAPLRARSDCQIFDGPLQPSRRALAEALAACEGVLCLLTDRIDAELIAACPDLKTVSSCSVGVDHIDLAAAHARGIAVGHTPGVLTETTADLAFALLMAAARRIVESDRFLRSGQWRPDAPWTLDGFVGRDLHGATLGVIGLGPIGQAVARRAGGFGMRVLGWSRSQREVEGVESVDFERVLRDSDFISIHVALCDETRGLIGARQLAAMKPGGILVNTARGGIVDEVALYDVLRSGHLAAAGLDVYAREPVVEHPLMELQNVVLTPHIGSASLATRARMADLAVQNLIAGLDGRPLVHAVPK